MCGGIESALSRRKFLRMLAAGTCAGVGHYALTPTNAFLANAAVGDGNVVVFVHTGGGWSLNVAPATHGTFIDRMGGTGNTSIYPASQTPLLIGGGQQILHPSLTRLHALYNAGRFLVVNKVQNPSFTRSHEDDTDQMLSGVLNRVASAAGEKGIGARIACMDPTNPLAAMSFAGIEAWSEGGCNTPQDLNSLETLGETAFHGDNRKHRWMTKARDAMLAGADPARSDRAAFVRNSVNDVQSTLDSVRAFRTVDIGTAFNGQGGLSNSMRDIAKIIVGERNLPRKTSTFLASTGGYDTHTDENQNLPGRLNELDIALGTFASVMQAQGMFDKVTVVVFGEFGRTWKNGSMGTDHGASQTVFVMGGRINGGRIANPPPSPAECAAGQYLRAYDVDFRSLFGQIVQGAFAVNPVNIFPDPISVGTGDLALFS